MDIYCSVGFFDSIMKHPSMVTTYAFYKAAALFEDSKTRVYATKRGSKKVFKVTNLETNEVKYVSRNIKIPSDIEFCQIWGE